MIQLTNKHIVLGITGGIAAYKSAELVRCLTKAHAHVRVVMTSGAKEFITPLTLQALSGNPVHHSLLDPEAEAGMGHIELAKWADLILIAPASANFIARFNQGMADDLLTTLCLATQAPIALAPAMNQAMWHDPTTQKNIRALQDIRADDLHIFGPGQGIQACGDTGFGRMLEPEDIAQQAANLFQTHSLSGQTVVITAGPTQEAIDPVRFISNHSSGKMGYAIAEAARDAGAKVILISGPVKLACPERVTRINVLSAQDMLDAVLLQVESADVFVASAAVADYRPTSVAVQKIKKDDDNMSIDLVKNPDIVATVASLENRPFIVGFAAETQYVETYARGKLIKKKLDMIIANDVSNTDIGFNSDNNAATLITPDAAYKMPMTSKQQLGRQIIQHIVQAKNTTGAQDAKTTS
jgi:phosphopantothenoylcysteine decarboxylase/phosphopantothenate--cysteine ligase